MEYDGSGMFSRRHYGGEFGKVSGVAQRDLADLDNDGNTVEHLLLTPLYDGAFDCVGVLGPTGAVVESYVHTYEGQVTITNASGQTISTSAIGWQQGYGRMYRDAESGLLYSLHRYYNPAIGRFVTEDPLGRWFDASGIGNARSFSANRYRNAWDPLGLIVLREESRPATAEEKEMYAGSGVIEQSGNRVIRYDATTQTVIEETHETAQPPAPRPSLRNPYKSWSEKQIRNRLAEIFKALTKLQEELDALDAAIRESRRLEEGLSRNEIGKEIPFLCAGTRWSRRIDEARRKKKDEEADKLIQEETALRRELARRQKPGAPR